MPKYPIFIAELAAQGRRCSGMALGRGLQRTMFPCIAGLFPAHRGVGEYGEHIEWVTKKFGNRTAVDLELLSTIVYINSEQDIVESDLLADRVKSVKPHFPESQIKRQIEWLASNDLITAA